MGLVFHLRAPCRLSGDAGVAGGGGGATRCGTILGGDGAARCGAMLGGDGAGRDGGVFQA